MRVLVIFHVYYEELVGYYLDRMSCIGGFDLIVTGNDLSEGTRDKIKAVRPDAVFLQCGNVGYDVWPFIAAVKSVNPEDYDFIIKLHTKNEDDRKFRIHSETMTGSRWRKYMVDALIGNSRRFRRLAASFRKDPGLGIAYSQKLNARAKGGLPEDNVMLSEELSRLGITPRSDMFCAGNMFAVRGAAVAFLLRDDIDESLFDRSGPTHGKASMAHVYERLVPIAVVSNGYTRKLIPSGPLSALYFALWGALGPAVQWLFSIDHYGNDSRRYLKLFGFKIPL